MLLEIGKAECWFLLSNVSSGHWKCKELGQGELNVCNVWRFEFGKRLVCLAVLLTTRLSFSYYITSNSLVFIIIIIIYTLF